MKKSTKPSLVHLPLERYAQRYTEHLHDWEVNAFQREFEVNTIDPTGPVVLNVNTGEVLDSVARCTHALQQTAQAVTMPAGSRIWLSDFFHPGYEAFPYARRNFEVSSFLWAQSFDQFDFTRKFVDWMRPYEFMALNSMRHVFLACSELADLITTSGSFSAELHVMDGLPFDSTHVIGQVDPSFSTGDMFDAVYSSRWDEEKNPGLFLDLVEAFQGTIRAAVCTGWDELRGTDHNALRRAKQLEDRGWLNVFRNCSKAQYYAVLSNSLVQVNTALQDWVSFTLLEALSFGCSPLYPNFRGFPEVLEHEFEHLYAPGSPSSLISKFKHLCKKGRGHNAGLGESILNKSDSVLPRIAKTLI